MFGEIFYEKSVSIYYAIHSIYLFKLYLITIISFKIKYKQAGKIIKIAVISISKNSTMF